MAAAALAVLLFATPASADADEAALLSRRLDGAVAAFSGYASVVLLDVRGGYRYALDADRVVPAASLYKLGVMIEAYRRAAEGSMSLDDALTVTDDDLTDDGYFTASGTTLTIREAVERMITVSDNSPARALVRVLDVHAINATMAALGAPHTRIETDLPLEEQSAPYNTTTAREMAGVFLGMTRGSIVGPKWSREMLAVLARQEINDRLPAGLPPSTVISHKTGNLPGIAHDAGVVTTPAGPRVLVMLTTDYVSYDDVVALAEQLASAAYGAMLDAFAARFDRVPGARTVAPGAYVRWETRVRNASSFDWASSTFVVERLRTATSTTEIGRIPLSGVRAGGALPLVINVIAPADPGTYVVELEVVDAQLGGSGNTLQLVLVVQP